MRKNEDYLVDVSATSGPNLPAATVEKVFDLVWRFDFTPPGFCMLDLGPGVDSHDLRSWMLALKEWLSQIAGQRINRRFACRSVGRFDQQETTKFHLDGAPAESLLVLGYEPSQVRSRMFLADYTRAAFDRSITPQEFLATLNPMYRKGEEALSGYVTELPEPGRDHYRILLVNNSSLPFTEARSNPLGVMHKAEILSPMTTERRIVNSMMLAVDEADEISQGHQREFVATEKIDQRVY